MNDEETWEDLEEDGSQKPTYIVTLQVTTEYTVERIEADSEEEATSKAWEAVENDFGWSSREDINTEVVWVGEDY